MLDKIKDKIKTITSSPGIYKFISSEGKVLYIGKAKNLQQRLLYYTKLDLSIRLSRMVNLASELEIITTNSEAEALLLEARLVKQNQPKFNILLKDDKSFPYIALREDHLFPQVIKYRSKVKLYKKSFGPFASNADVEATLSELSKVFKLRTCSDNYFASRKRPCLQYQVKRCSGPCAQKISKEDYDELVAETESFLSGRGKILQENLAKKMENLSANMEYEKAAEIRDRIKALSYIQMKFNSSEELDNADLIMLKSDDKISAILVAFYRNGQYYGNHIYFLEDIVSSSDSEMLSSFIEQFYYYSPPPPELLVTHPVEDEKNLVKALYDLHKVRTKITMPQKGGKFHLMNTFQDTLTKALNQKIITRSSQDEIFYKLQILFNLPSEIERIEIYDNSHIMGTDAVGGMVVAGKSGFLRKEYRYYNLISSSNKGGDDYAMLAEVMAKRLEKIIQNPSLKPSLMIIDGGKGHMNIVESVMQKYGLFVPFVCMSKGPNRNAGLEQFHIPGREVFTLDRDDKVMRYLQILRDEAHNFAIKSHRKKRSKKIKSSILDNIEGIGPKRKKDLLYHFGCAEAVKNASLEELENIQTIGKSVARKIFHALHNSVI